MSDDDNYWSRGMPSTNEYSGTCRACGGSGKGFFGNECGTCGGSGSVEASYPAPSNPDEYKCSWGPESDNT